MSRLFRRNGLALVTFGLFLIFAVIMSITANRQYNQDQREHNESEVGYVEYLGTGDFKESLFENWESEFLQMGAYVLLTASCGSGAGERARRRSPRPTGS